MYTGTICRGSIPVTAGYDLDDPDYLLLKIIDHLDDLDRGSSVVCFSGCTYIFFSFIHEVCSNNVFFC